MRRYHIDWIQGSSPLTRGKRAWSGRAEVHHGLIPAHAGKTATVRVWRVRDEAHPRSRGENAVSCCQAASGAGSSPLTRGKQGGGLCGCRRGRLIPAHAGKTWREDTTRSISWAHPRSRGENPPRPQILRPPAGSSPLTRGKRRPMSMTAQNVRLIPAHAGKTWNTLIIRSTMGAHPRSRGENRPMIAMCAVLLGSSPLTRGKQLQARNRVCVVGLIPAHAGKTLPDLRFYRADRSDLGKP